MRRARCVALCAAALALSLPPPAAAQSAAELAQAKKWFKEGEAAEKKGECRTAVDLFKKALTVKETPQLHLRIGSCQERVGDLLAAQGSFERSLERATAANLQEVADVAREELEKVRPRVPTVTFTLKEAPRELALKLDGLPLAQTSLGNALPLNPGDHTIFAEARGRGAFTKTFTLAEKERASIAIELPEGSGAEDAPPPPGPALRARGPGLDAPATSGEGPSIPAIALMAGGGAAVIGGAVLLVVSFSKDSDIDDRCGGSDRPSCPLREESDINGDIDTVNLMRGIGIGLAGAGVVAGGIGVALWVTSSSSNKKTGAPIVVTPTFGGLSARGRF